MPLTYHVESGEMFISLPMPYQNIRITAARISDVPAQAKIMNDPAIAMNFTGMPLPYSEQDAADFISMLQASTCRVMNACKQHTGDLVTFLGPDVPVHILREIQPDGTDAFLGNVVLRRSAYQEVEDLEERTRLANENLERRNGDPSIEWMFCTSLIASHHGRGIMTAAVRAMISEWGLPHLQMRNITACAFLNNIGSQRVFLKNGFSISGSVEVWDKGDLAKRGRLEATDGTLVMLKWREQSDGNAL